MDILKYIPIIVGIRNHDFTTLITPQTITDNDLCNIHKRVIKKFHDINMPCGLIFENEIYLTRNLANINNNEIKTFVQTNSDWDILVISDLKTATTLNAVDGYSRIKQITEKNNFSNYYNHIYIVSARFMTKVVNDESTDNINLYVYTAPFLDNLKTKSKVNKYTIGEVTDISILNAIQVKYTWRELIV